jgi:RNA polymerase sigma-70 factor, ECF subfamily
MHQSYVRPGSAAAAVPAIVATAGQYSSDEMLVERIASGRQARHAGPVRPPSHLGLSLAVPVCRQRDRGRDLLSDVFFDVWQQAGRFEGRSAVTTWLLSIARLKALSARRRRTHVELNEVIAATVADSADNAEVVLEKKHQGEMLRDALSKLSPEHREIIDLVYYHEKSVDDAASSAFPVPR